MHDGVAGQDVAHRGAAWRGGDGALAARWEAPDARRRLQLGLAAIWLLDAVLQYQSFMFTRAFGRVLAASAAGNPAAVADPVSWVARLVEQHPQPANAAFATIQLLIAVGIAWRPAVRCALAASVAWSLGVWWFGEGLGGVLTGGASPVSGAPGAVIIYALLAVLLWPANRDTQAPFPAGRAVGRNSARAAWLVLWASLAWFAIAPASSTPQGMSGMLAGMTAGEPGWLAAVGHGAATLVAHQGLLASAVLAAVLAAIAAGVFLPPRAARVTLVLAIVTAAVIWVAGEELGGIFTGAGTDPNSGPLLILLALAYWPRNARPAAATPAPGTPAPGTRSAGAGEGAAR